MSFPALSPEGARPCQIAPSGLERANDPFTQAVGLGCTGSPLRGFESLGVGQHTFGTLPAAPTGEFRNSFEGRFSDRGNHEGSSEDVSGRLRLNASMAR